MTDDAPTRGTFVHDLRHRFSAELRPDAHLDVTLRNIATQLELADLVHPGASTAPRFHPHLTVTRSAVADEDLAARVAAAVARHDGGAVTFDRANTFGDGRIIFLEPADDAPARAARAEVVTHLDCAAIDPLVLSREWTPHVTVAYDVPVHARADALEHVRSCLPVTGRFATAEAWDLDVRPTVLVARASIPTG